MLQGRSDKPACDGREVTPSQVPPHLCGWLELMGQPHADWFPVSQREQTHDGTAEGKGKLGAGLQVSERVIAKFLWLRQRMMVFPAKVCDAVNAVESHGHSVVPHAVLFSIVNLCVSFSSPMQKHTKNSAAMLTNIFSLFWEKDVLLKPVIFFFFPSF